MKKFLFSLTLLLSSLCANAQTTQEWRDSILVLQQLIDKYPKDLELKMRKAEANIALEQWTYAMDEYNKILELYPTHIGAFYFRAYVNYKLRRYAFARADYEQVLKFEPRHMNAFIGLIRTNLADGQLQKAQDEADFLVGLYPDSLQTYLCRAEVEIERGMLDLAIQDYTNVISEEERHIGINQRLTGSEPYCQDIIDRMELYRRKADRISIELMSADRLMLIRRGIPSERLRSFEIVPKKKNIKD